MASTQLSHLSPLASSHRTSIAFSLLFITIFVVPFLSLSSSELIPSVLPTIAYTLWESLLAILTSSPFYFFLLNFLIVALVFSSRVLDASSPGRAFDGLQEGDLHQRGLHNYSTAVQMIHERLALDELYESQAPSSPYLNITENSRTYIAEDGMIGNGYGDEGEAHNDKGKEAITNPIASFLFQRAAFSDADGSDASEEGSSSGKVHALDEFLVTGSMVGNESDINQISPVSSLVVDDENVDLHDACKGFHAKDVQVYDRSFHPARDADADADAGADADADADADAGLENDKDKGADVISNGHKGANDVTHDENGDDHVGDGNVDSDEECHDMEAEADVDGEQLQRIARTIAQPIIAGTIGSQEPENVGAEMGLSGEGGSMSTEELNERASAFISAFRRKLISTAIDDVSGQM